MARGPDKPRSTPAPPDQRRRAIDRFLDEVATTPLAAGPNSMGRLLFALDATMSRQPTWDAACRLQANMFDAAADLGGLDIKLTFFRGLTEFRASPWLADARALAGEMTAIQCRAGPTQIERVLQLAVDEARRGRLNALVYVGDCMEEDPDRLCRLAGELGILDVPVFVFHEGRSVAAMACFRDLAQLSGGAYCPFDVTAGERLKDLLSAVAAYAAGGKSAVKALCEKHGAPAAIRALLEQLR